MQRFIEESTIHGIKEIHEATGIWKVVWILLGLTAAGCMISIISILTYDFFQEPTFDNTELATTAKYPPVRIWPWRFVDRGLAAQYGMDNEHARRYLATLLPQQIPQTWADPTAFGDQLEAAKNNVSNILGEAPEPIYDLINNISAPFESVIEFEPRLAAFFNVSDTQMKPSGIGQSYVFDTGLRLTQLTAESLALKFSIQRDPSMLEQLVSNDYSRANDFITFGELAYSDMDSSASSLKHGFDYDIELRYEVYTIINLRRRPCRNYTHGEHWTCMFHCYNREICLQSDANCILTHSHAQDSEYAETAKGRACSWLEPTHCFYYSNSYKDKQMLCTNECPIPCRLEKYIVTASPSSTSATQTKSTISVHFVNPSQFKIVNEEYVYTGVGLFSNYGGTISLFFGASVMSVIQAAYYLVFKRERQKK